MPTHATPHEGNAARLLMLPSAYPFDIYLTNRKGNATPALYIVSDVDRTADAQQIDLSIRNITDDDYQVGSVTLCFRRGTLHEDLTKNNAQKFCEVLKAAAVKAFNISAEIAVELVLEEPANIGFEISFKNEVAGGPKFSFPKNTPVTLSLSGIYAAPGTGTRTSGYEIKFEGVQKMAGSNPSGPAFSFGRNAVLQVINHQGFSSAPMHFGVMGNNFLLNAPGTQEIAIFMQSLDGKPLAMDKENTKFVFSFYAGERSDGSSIGNDGCTPFGNLSEVNAIALKSLPAGFNLDKEHDSTVDEHGRRDIIIKSSASTSTSFALFTFNNIQLSGISGLTKVHVTVENLPGYWDSNFEVTFIKGPMVMVGNQVGIGTQPVAENALSVKGGVDIRGNLTLDSLPAFVCRAFVRFKTPRGYISHSAECLLRGNVREVFVNKYENGDVQSVEIFFDCPLPKKSYCIVSSSAIYPVGEDKESPSETIESIRIALPPEIKSISDHCFAIFG